MKTVAAVLNETGKPLVLAELEIPALRPGQVLVEIVYSGVCHTQVLECRGRRGEDRWMPHCLGHEGSGVVLETSPGVTKVKTGDRAILSWIKGSGCDVLGTVYQWNGRNVNAGGITTFSRHAVIAENRLTPLRDGVSMEDAALMGCAVPTGLGVVFNTLAPRPGQAVAVFGAGGIGLCAIGAAAISGCTPVIAVDILPEKLELARRMGATMCIDASRTNPVQEIAATCGGGVDYAVEASGRPDVMLQALQAVRSQGGVAAIVGNARYGERLELDPAQLNQGKQLRGTWGGDNIPDRDFPRYVNLLQSGRLNLDPLRSTVYGLSQINQAIDDLEAGKVARPLIDMSKD
ncbi:MAG: zinc-binding dehydrogenase [Desulfomonile tiedjei]|nr:zinc-binding dehydrogenase [Desulfomonile tiedjei]